MKIGIVSLGLIGGSIFKALKDCNIEIACVSTNQKTLNYLQNLNINSSNDLYSLKNCDIVFVCSPMRNVLEILDKLENILAENTIVTDVCSLKEFVMNKERKYIFIPSHPMTGKETSGFEESEKNLFQDAKWILTPFKNTEQKDIEKLSSIIKLMGAKIVIADAKEHDRAAALISHMPIILSQALIKAVEKDNLAKTLASSGFRDMTRLALSSTVMAKDMAEMNEKNIHNALNLVIENSQLLLKNYNTDTIEEIKTIRKKIYSKEGKNIF